VGARTRVVRPVNLVSLFTGHAQPAVAQVDQPHAQELCKDVPDRGAFARWSPDSKSVYYCASGAIMAVDIQPGRNELSVAPSRPVLSTVERVA